MHQIDILNYTYGCMYTLDVTVPTSDQICTGISEIDKQTALNIFPNPANTLLNIEYGDVVSESEGYMLELCNGLGQTIYSKKPEAGNTEKINVSTLPNGLYIVLLKRNNAILSASKFVRE